jgi:hypothetical protein
LIGVVVVSLVIVDANLQRKFIRDLSSYLKGKLIIGEVLSLHYADSAAERTALQCGYYGSEH